MKHAIIYCLVAEEGRYPELNRDLEEYRRLVQESRLEGDEYVEAGAIHRADPRFESFRPMNSSLSLRSQDAQEQEGCAVENMVLTYGALRASVERKEFDTYQVIFLPADPNLWYAPLEALCRQFGMIKAAHENVFFRFLYPGGAKLHSALEQYMEEHQLSDGDARDSVIMGG